MKNNIVCLENEQEKAERDKLQSVFERFWQELPIVLKQAPSQSKIRDTVQLDQVVQFESIPPNVDLDLDERVSHDCFSVLVVAVVFISAKIKILFKTKTYFLRGILYKKCMN